MSDWARDILALEPQQETRYAPFDLNRLMVFVIADLQERGLPVTFESATVAAFRLFPAKFALLGFSSYPDAARVNRALLQLRPKYRNWATGDVQRGFVLTEGGKRILSEVRAALGGDLPVRRPQRAVAQEGTPRSRDLSADLSEVENSSLYRSWTRDKALDPNQPDDVYALLGAYPYAPKKALRDRLEVLRLTAEHAGRAKTADFLTQLKRVYRPVFQETG